MPVLGLDVSNHQGEIRAGQVAAWKAKGFEHACVRLSLERPDMIALARRQIAAFQLGGMSTSGYIWMYADLGDPRGVAEQTVGEYGDTGVVRYWVDVEDEGHSLSPGGNVAWLHVHLDALMNLSVPFGIYCVAAETPILTGDLRWVPAGDLRDGDPLIAFDEYGVGMRGQKTAPRHLQRARLVATEPRMADLYDVVLTTGERLRCTADHPWLVRYTERGGIKGGTVWKTAQEIARLLDHPQRVMPLIMPRYFHPWPTANDYTSGFLAAAFDGEGHVEKKPGANARLAFAQKPNGFLEAVEHHLARAGYGFTRSPLSPHNGCHQVRLTGGGHASMKFLGSLRPPRLLDNWLGIPLGGKEMRAVETVGIEAVVPAGRHEIASMTTNTGTFIANGFGAHNTGQWFWRVFMGNSQDFRNVALWDANWDGVPDLDRFVPYGGWTGCVAKQYGGSGFDADIWDESVIGEDDMARIAELEAQVRDLTTWGDAVVAQNIVRRQALEAALQAPNRTEEKRGVQAVINNLKRDEG